ncbi:MAG TPA: methyltransferase domain-containing protein [Flavobacteriales bacterium]|nr:methyltransferase domain-containing protein [Flavobacteriales bacterium]HQW87737.1 methyltransferase domain-containing protein [Flavobacteriales bacterium]
MNGTDQRLAVSAAFSRQSPVFDAIDEGNTLITRMRTIVRSEAIRHMRPGQDLLELNAGTGIDAFWFADQGLRVLATDDAAGMIDRMRAKQQAHPEAAVEVMSCSFLHLDQLGDRRFDHVFSNFGGLNCTDRLDRVLDGIDRVLRPGGTCVLVLMPHFSPWEALAVLKGRLRHAFRRFRRGGTTAHLEGITFTCTYHGPGTVIGHLGPGYTVIAQRALSLTVPPPHHEGLPRRWPRLLRALHTIEEAIAHRWPFHAWGDHVLIILRKRA